MDKEEFAARFEKAANHCRRFCQRCVTSQLPERLRFDIYAENFPIHTDGRLKFLGGRLLKASERTALDRAQICKLLWVEREIPDWINLTVDAYDDVFSYVEVTLSTRLTDDDNRFMHQQEGNPPFHILGPPGGSPDHRIALRRRDSN